MIGVTFFPSPLRTYLEEELGKKNALRKVRLVAVYSMAYRVELVKSLFICFVKQSVQSLAPYSKALGTAEAILITFLLVSGGVQSIC